MVKEFIQTFREKAHKSRIQNLEFYIKQSESQTLQIYQQEVERLTFSDEAVAFIEGEYQGHRGATFVENMATARLDEHLETIKQMAVHDRIPFQPRRPADVAALKTKLYGLPSVEELAQKAKQAAYDYDQRIDNVSACSYGAVREKISLLNADGTEAVDHLHYDQFRFGLLAKEGGLVQTASENKLFKPDDRPDLVGTQKALSQLTAAPVKTGEYPIILENRPAAELILAFLPGFYADRVQKKMSVLADRLGEKIAASSFNLIEDPALAAGIVTRNFDDEGTLTKRKDIVSEGVLQTFFHNSETAKLAKTKSTGNGFKRQYREKPQVLPTNILIPGSKRQFNDLLSTMAEGLVVTDCDGIFAGANPVSGDFSLIAKGYSVKGGVLKDAVNQITIGGNFYEMLEQITELGNDYAWAGSPAGFVQAPSLLLKRLFVSGS